MQFAHAVYNNDGPTFDIHIDAYRCHGDYQYYCSPTEKEGGGRERLTAHSESLLNLVMVLALEWYPLVVTEE